LADEQVQLFTAATALVKLYHLGCLGHLDILFLRFDLTLERDGHWYPRELHKTHFLEGCLVLESGVIMPFLGGLTGPLCLGGRRSIRNDLVLLPLGCVLVLNQDGLGSLLGRKPCQRKLQAFQCVLNSLLELSNLLKV
jgi:hypothetical protein